MAGFSALLVPQLLYLELKCIDTRTLYTMSDAPQVVYSSAPQAVFRAKHHEQPKQEIETYPSEALVPAHFSSTILGVHRRDFWILVTILLVVNSASVGGSVGGALAVRNSMYDFTCPLILTALFTKT
jgi:hypothetical protein